MNTKIPRPWRSAAFKDRIFQAARKGDLTITQIADANNVSTHKVKYWLNELGLDEWGYRSLGVEAAADQIRATRTKGGCINGTHRYQLVRIQRLPNTGL